MNAIEKVEEINKVASMHRKGYSNAEISKQLNLPVAKVKADLDEWSKYIEEKAASDPEILDRFLENTLAFEEELNDITKEIWEVIKKADEADVISTKIQALRLAKDLTDMKARLFQLLSPRVDSGYIERSKRIERVNSMLSEIIRETISDCDRCSELAWRKLEDVYRSDKTLRDDDDDYVEEDEDVQPLGELEPGIHGRTEEDTRSE